MQYSLLLFFVKHENNFLANTSVLVQLWKEFFSMQGIFEREKTSLICWKVTNAFIFAKEVEISENGFLKIEIYKDLR